MKDFMDYIIKNKYVIICVAIVVVLYALGIVDFLFKFVMLIALVILAIWIGKKLQDYEGHWKELFNLSKFKREKEDVYYYQDSKNDKN